MQALHMQGYIRNKLLQMHLLQLPSCRLVMHVASLPCLSLLTCISCVLIKPGLGNERRPEDR
jgi:hypothetical protein